MASKYDFRILIDTIDGENLSFGSSSFVSVQPNTSLVVNTDDMVDKINSMRPIQYFNGKTHTTASSLYDTKGFSSFLNTNIDGSSTDYQYLSASIKGNSDSGSILFHANDTPTAGGDYIKRYKFFGNKVCNVLGVPENYWIYADKFRLTNTGSEQNYISGDVLAQSLHLTDNFAISNAGAIESDLPMRHSKDTDRWIKWTDVSSSIPQNDMLIGYGNQSNEYMIRMQNNKNLIISSSAVTARGDFKIENDLHLYGNKIYGDSDKNTYIDFGATNEINLYSADREQINVGYSGVVFNEAGNNIDFRFETDNDQRCLTIQGGEDRVGIGMSALNAAVAKFDVRGDVGSHSYGTALFRGNTDQTGSISLQSDAGTVFTMAVIENKTAFGLAAIGVPDTIKDKDYPFKISNEGKVSVTGSFSLEATMPAYHTIGAAISTDTDVFLGFGPSISTFPEDTDTDDQDTRITAAFDGYVKRVILKGNTNLGTLNTLKLAKAGSGTAASAVDDNVIASSMAGNMATANVPVAFNGTRNNHSFSAGDTLAFKFSPGQVLSSTQIDGVVVLMYDVTDD